MNKFSRLNSRLNFKIQNNCYSNRRKGNILYTTLSFLFIGALLYTVNLQMYQSARRNLHNIDRAYQAQTLAILAAEYADRHAQTDAMTVTPATDNAPQSVAAQAPPTTDSSAGQATDSASGSSAMASADVVSTVLPDNSLLEEAAAAPQTLHFNIGDATVDPSQQPRLVTVKLHDDPLTYRFTY